MILLVCMMGAVIFLVSQPYSVAQTNQSSLNIGVVSIDTVLRDCKATANFRDRMNAENAKKKAEMEQLSLEIQALDAGLRSGALVVGSEDYFKQHLDLAKKEANLQALNEYYPQQQNAEQQIWTQQLYQKILKATKELAEEKGLPLVIERSEPDFSVQRDLGLIISTHKVIYSRGCVDITNDVLAKLDAEESEEQAKAEEEIQTEN
jgi:Skp family chaperone for outer membrane proteins